MKYLCIILFLAISISSCQQQAVNEKCEKNIIVCFDHYHPKPYKTPGGVGHMPMPKVLYTDSIGTLVEYMPNKDSDTLTIYSTEHFKELGLNYGDFEFNYYPLMKGDTVIISMDSLGYPILSSKHHPGYSRIYNILKSATKLFSVLLASKRPLITELADKLRLKYPLLPTISPCPTMRLEAIRSIIPISCRRYPKSV